MDYTKIAQAFARHKDTVEKSAALFPDIQSAADILLAAFRNKGKLLMCGNGGSAADSQHFAAEWMCHYKDDRPPYPAIALSTDTSALTAIGNDYGFESIFSRQVRALGNQGDVLVAFTTSGQSKNILAAIHEAKSKGMKVIALTGERGAALKEVADVAIVVPSGETARIQEVHEIVCHAWCELLDAAFRE